MADVVNIASEEQPAVFDSSCSSSFDGHVSSESHASVCARRRESANKWGGQAAIERAGIYRRHHHTTNFCAASWALNPKIAVGKLRVGKAHFG